MLQRFLRRDHGNDIPRALARGLGWFSIALGIAELIAPRTLARGVGLEGHAQVAQFYGLREIGAGIGILCAKDPAPWIWGRVAGDALDLASLLPAMRSGNPARGHAGLALGAVAAVTLLDVCCARQLARTGRNGGGTVRRLRSAARP